MQSRKTDLNGRLGGRTTEMNGAVTPPAEPSAESTRARRAPPRPGTIARASSISAESTAERVLATAARLFRTKGYSATTTREIAKEVGIEKGSLYYHARAKEDLLYNVCVDSLNHITHAVQRAFEDSEEEHQLEAVIEAHVTSMLAERDKHATMLIELRGLAPARRRRVIKLRDQYEALLRNAISNNQKLGRLRSDVDAKVLTLALLNLLNWTIFWFDPEGEYSAKQIAVSLTELYLRGSMAP